MTALYSKVAFCCAFLSLISMGETAETRVVGEPRDSGVIDVSSERAAPFKIGDAYRCMSTQITQQYFAADLPVTSRVRHAHWPVVKGFTFAADPTTGILDCALITSVVSNDVGEFNNVITRPTGQQNVIMGDVIRTAYNGAPQVLRSQVLQAVRATIATGQGNGVPNAPGLTGPGSYTYAHLAYLTALECENQGIIPFWELGIAKPFNEVFYNTPCGQAGGYCVSNRITTDCVNSADDAVPDLAVFELSGDSCGNRKALPTPGVDLVCCDPSE